MLEHLMNESNRAFTENGAVTLRTTGSDCLDLFATVGALRGADDNEIVTRFMRAFAENKDAATKLLFYARDVRGGLGERRVFRLCLRWLAHNAPDTVRKNLQYVAEYGRYDDLLSLLGTPCEAEAVQLIHTVLREDAQKCDRGETITLLAKWLPSVNASNKETVRQAKHLARALGMTDAAYRKLLVRLRAHIRILENSLRERDYTFDYEKQPSRALFKYRQAFQRNDPARYAEFLARVQRGEAKLHADNVAPYELVLPYLARYGYRFLSAIPMSERASLNATWESLPDFGGTENAIAVVDTSGSMYGNGALPAAVALSLGLYFAERNRGIFGGHFIEFSTRPRLIRIKGDTFVDRLQYVASLSVVADTNIEAVFDLVLHAAVSGHVKQSELPAKLIIISDMEFNACARNASVSNFENAKARYEAAGYRLPDVVFWNVASRNTQQPVKMNERGVALVSGCTPRLFSMVAGGTVSPYACMMEILYSERYAPILA